MHTVDITPLFEAAGIDKSSSVGISELMSGVETNPKDDWMYLGLRTICDIAKERGDKIHTAAGIGSGNGIVEIGMLHVLPSLTSLAVTDVIAEILPSIRRNIEKNSDTSTVSMQYIAGADCNPLPEPVDFIYANLPLIMVEEASLKNLRATTTLTDAKRYEYLSEGNDDVLRRWSLLSQLGFLHSAKEKLTEDGVILTLIGGRVPYTAIRHLFARAGLRFRERSCAFKKQSDPEFLREYAEYERRERVEFSFYDYPAATEAIEHTFGVTMPDVLSVPSEEILETIASSRLNAAEAHEHTRQGNSVGHLAYAFEASR